MVSSSRSRPSRVFTTAVAIAVLPLESGDGGRSGARLQGEGIAPGRGDLFRAPALRRLPRAPPCMPRHPVVFACRPVEPLPEGAIDHGTNTRRPAGTSTAPTIRAARRADQPKSEPSPQLGARVA